jgi:hypothetical protein
LLAKKSQELNISIQKKIEIKSMERFTARKTQQKEDFTSLLRFKPFGVLGGSQRIGTRSPKPSKIGFDSLPTCSMNTVQVIKLESTTEDTASVIKDIFERFNKAQNGWKFQTTVTDSLGDVYLVFTQTVAWAPHISDEAREMI